MSFLIMWCLEKCQKDQKVGWVDLFSSFSYNDVISWCLSQKEEWVNQNKVRKSVNFFQWKPGSAELHRPETFTNVKVVKVFPLPPSLSAFVDDISTKFLIISFLVEKLSQKVAAAAAVLFSNVHLLGSAPWLLNQRYLDLSPYRWHT